MVGVAKADFCGASAAPSKRAPRRQRETVRNILLFIVMDGAGGAGGAREEGCATGEPGTGDRVEKPPAWDPVPGARRISAHIPPKRLRTREKRSENQRHKVIIVPEPPKEDVRHALQEIDTRHERHV